MQRASMRRLRFGEIRMKWCQRRKEASLHAKENGMKRRTEQCNDLGGKSKCVRCGKRSKQASNQKTFPWLSVDGKEVHSVFWWSNTHIGGHDVVQRTVDLNVKRGLMQEVFGVHEVVDEQTMVQKIQKLVFGREEVNSG